MLTFALALLALTGAQAPVEATRFDMGVRLLRLDEAWLAQTDPERRAAAVPAVSAAVAGFFARDYAGACRALDRAYAALRGEAPSPALALRFVVTPEVGSPDREAEVALSFVYPVPTDGPPLAVEVAGRALRLTPPEGARFRASFAELARSARRVAGEGEEGDFELVLEVEGTRVTAPFSVVKDFPERLNRMREDDVPLARSVAEELEQDLTRGSETALRAYTRLRFAERRGEGVPTGEIPTFRHQGTRLRGWIPDRKFELEANRRPVVVIALHGAGGSENLFVEGYGRGLAVRLARERGWIFLSPTATPRAVDDALDWLASFEIRPGALFVMGHSMGGGLTLGLRQATPRAIALFAPAGRSIPERLRSTPVFLAVGKQELPMLLQSAEALRRQIEGREDAIYRLYEPCEHLMIVADALPDAYAFFDRYARP